MPARRPGLLAWLRGPGRAGAGADGGPARRVMALVEEYETRLMYSADLAATGLTLAGAGQVSEQRVVDSSGEFVQAAQSVRHEVLIVGSDIKDSQTLLDSLAGDGREIEVLVLDPAADSIRQISDFLSTRHDLDAIHVLSHGAEGQLDLGGAPIDSATLTARAGEIAAWGNSLNAHADLLLYGCDVAAGDQGLAFVAQLASLTGSDVAASNDLTGNQSGVGGTAGNWTLEVQTGHIETANIFTAAARQSWTGTLEARVNSTTTGMQTKPAVAINASGAYVVTWTTENDGSGNGIKMQRYNPDGSAAGAETQVNTNTTGDQVDSAVAMASNGSFVVVWSSRPSQSGGTSIQAQRFNADGSLQGGEFTVNQNSAGSQELPAISMQDNGDFVVAWQNTDQQQVAFRRFSANGTATSGDIAVDGSSTTSQQAQPAIKLNNSGMLVITWQSNGGASGDAIFARIYNGDNSPATDKFRVNTYDNNDQRSPSISGDAAGNFVISWTSFGQNGTGQGIYAQRFAASGARLGGEIVVNDDAGDQNQSAVGMMGDGTFDVIGTSLDGADTGVGRREYSAAGVAGYGPALVNTTTTGNQNHGAMAVNITGAIVVVWQGNGYGDDHGVFLRKFQINNDEAHGTPDVASTTQNAAYNSSGTGVLANDTDAENNPLKVVQIIDAAGAAHLVSAAGVTVTGAYGSLFIKSNGSFTYTPNTTTAKALGAGQSAADVFTYAVSDGYSSGSPTLLTINVSGVNDTPVAVADGYAIGKTGTITVSAGGLLANDTDIDGDTLTVSAVKGAPGRVGNSFNTDYGTIRVNADGSMTYTVDNTNPAVFGLLPVNYLTDQVSYTISDGKGGSSTSTITIYIEGNQHAPVGNNDGYTLLEGATLTVGAATGVLANDTDASGDQMHATLASATTHGTLSFSQAGGFVYTPNAGFSGTDSFTYRSTDGSMNSALTTVTLTVTHVNHDPVAVADSIQVNKGATAAATSSGGLLANDSDVDSATVGDVLRITSFRSTAGGSSNAVSVPSNSSATFTSTYGTLTVYGSGQYTYTANGAASMLLGAGETSNDIFDYTISDGNGGNSTAQLSFVIAGVDTAPAISGTAAGQATTDKSSLTPFSAVTIADGATQTVTVTVTMDLAARGSFSNLGQGAYNQANGTYIVSGTGTVVTAALRALVFTPTANRVAPNGSETTRLSLNVSDGSLESNDYSTTVVATSVNDAPVVTGVTAAQSGNSNASLAPFSALTISDADNPGQTMTVTVTLSNAANGSLSNNGVGSYNAGSGVYTFTGTAAAATTALRTLLFTPTQNQATPGTVVNTVLAMNVSDTITSSNASTALSITAVNSPPSISQTSGTQGTNDNASVQPFAAILIADADNPPQTLSVSVSLDVPGAGQLTNLGGGAYNASTGVYTFSGTASQATTALRGLLFTPTANRNPPGSNETVTLSVLVNDGFAQASNNSTRVVVTSYNDAPVISGSSGAQTINDNASLHPFAAMSVSDADQPAQTLSLTVTMDHPEHGTLSVSTSSANLVYLSSGTLTYDPGTGSYTYSGTAGQVSVALQALVFTPNANRLQPGNSETTVLTVAVSDGMTTTSDSSTRITAVSVNDAPTITGTLAGQSATDSGPAQAVQPFHNVTIQDPDSGAQVLTLTVTLDQAGKGTLSNGGAGTYDATTGVYTLSGSAAAITSTLRGLVFSPTSNRIAPGSQETTTLSISVYDGYVTTSDAGTTVVTTSVNDAPQIAGTTGAKAINDNQTVYPFTAVVVSDADNPAQTLTLTVTLSNAAMGQLSNPNAGSYDAVNGVYSVSGTAAQVNAAINALLFTPTANHIAPGSSETVTLRIDVSDGLATSSNNSTRVTTTSINDAPTIGLPAAAVAGQSVNDNASLQPFAGAVIGDADNPAQTLTMTVTLDNVQHGALSNTAGGTYDASTGVYSFTGTAGAATAALQGLVFTPVNNRLAPGNTESSVLRVAVSDGALSASAAINVATVSVNDAPLISGAVAGQLTDDQSVIQPFATVTIADPDTPAQVLSVSVTLDLAARGSLSNLSGGSYDAASGVYSFSGTAAQATAALRALVFAPTANRVAPGSSEITTLRIDVSDGLAAVSDSATSVSAASVNDAPVITGAGVALNTADNQALNPFTAVSVSDADSLTQPLSVTVRLDHAELGTISNLSGGSYNAQTGTYSLAGSAGQISAALQALVFTPTPNRVAPGNIETAQFSLSVSDGFVTTAAGSTGVAILSINDAPVATSMTINGATNEGQAVVITLSATDPDDAVASFTLGGLPANGILSTDAAGTHVLAAGAHLNAVNNAVSLYFTPLTGWGGTTQFSYLATDHGGLNSAMQAVVQVIMVAPPTQTVQQGDLAQAPKSPAASAAASGNEGKAAGAASEAKSGEAAATAVAVQQLAPAPALEASAQLVTEAVVSATVQTQVERVADQTSRLTTEHATVVVPNFAVLNMPTANLTAQTTQAVYENSFSAQARAAVESSTEAPEMIGSLDQMRDTAKIQDVKMEQMVESTAAASTAVTVGYVLWLLRGGVLAASMLTALPAWRFVDPLPVLGGLKNGAEADEDDSLEKLVGEGGDGPEPDPVGDEPSAEVKNRLEKDQ